MNKPETIKEILACHETKLDVIKETVENIDKRLVNFDERIRKNEKHIFGIEAIGSVFTVLASFGIAIWRIFKG